jgi:predicted amidophosphoribosyltransferase
MQSDGPSKTCSSCNSPNRATHKFCWKCGKPLS